MSMQPVSQIDIISINLAELVAAQAVGFSQTLVQLFLRNSLSSTASRPDGVTALRRAMLSLPVSSATTDSFTVAIGAGGAIGSTSLSNEEALALCYRLRVELGSLRPLGAEIIHSTAYTRAKADEIMRQVLLIDWSKEAWNAELMQTVNRFRTFILSFSRTSSAFSDADEDKSEKYTGLIRDSFVPECHQIALSLVRSYLPTITANKDQLLETASDNLIEFDRLYNLAQMPLFFFSLFKSFRTLPAATRELLSSKDDLSDIRDALPEIFDSYVSNANYSPAVEFETLGLSQYAPDNFELVSQFSEVADFLKEKGEFAGLEILLMLYHSEMLLRIDLLKIDLIEYVIEQNSKRLAEPLSAFCSALSFASSKLSYSNGYLLKFKL